MMSNRNEVCFTYCYIAQMINFGSVLSPTDALSSICVYIDVESQEKLYA
ncbi:hypothetical protein [Paenibacillus glycanilyticus]|nr:hypothetical protein [Paenibacillus glycanilyticus]